MANNWITEISLDNYRAFGKPQVITIPNNSHLLIYGENGSGKSSIFHALKDFFKSSVNPIVFKINKFQGKEGNTDGFIKLKITTVSGKKENIYEYKFTEPSDDSDHQIPIIILSNKIKGFLDYKRMLSAHSLDIPDGKQPNIFDLIIKDLLSEHRIAHPKGGTTTVELFESYNSIKNNLLNNPKHSNIYKVADVERIKLNASIKTLLRDVFTIVNQYLNTYFKNKIEVGLIFNDIEIQKPNRYKKKIIVENLELKIKYAGEEIPFYQTFLNEARLSSLALCIYLASIKIFNIEGNRLKVLYLDDVFIGLDTSNRFPLLEIIKNEFIDNGFQIFMSTYDREWFELSRQWFTTRLNGKVKGLELYIEDDGNPNTPDYPIVISYKTNIERAESHFKANDYAAAANYIRKECEQILKQLLPVTYQFDSSGNIIEKFEDLLNQLDKLYDDCILPCPKELIDSIKIYRKALLNPASHSDLSSPIFKKEIQEAFEIVKKLRTLEKINRVLVAQIGQIITYENKTAKYKAEFELATNLWKIIQPTGNTFSNHKYRIIKWTWKGVDYAINAKGVAMPEKEKEKFCLHERNLKDIFTIINTATKIPIPADIYAEIKIGATGTLSELL